MLTQGYQELKQASPDAKEAAVTFLHTLDHLIAAKSAGTVWKDPTATAKEWTDCLQLHAKALLGMRRWSTSARGRCHGDYDHEPASEDQAAHGVGVSARNCHAVAPCRVQPCGLPRTPFINGNRKRQHHAAMPWQDVPAFMSQLSDIGSTAADALRFVILTAARSGEVTGAKWDEIDFKARTWTIPAARMKMNRVHVVPLSDAALALLQARKAVQQKRDFGFIFPSRKK